jgi:hypothetical protein
MTHLLRRQVAETVRALAVAVGRRSLVGSVFVREMTPGRQRQGRRRSRWLVPLLVLFMPAPVLLS